MKDACQGTLHNCGLSYVPIKLTSIQMDFLKTLTKENGGGRK